MSINIIELEKSLRESEMDYSLKVNLFLRGVASTPCTDCPFKNERFFAPIWERTKKCFQKCPFGIVIWILSKEQLMLYETVRSERLKERDIRKAREERQIIEIRIIEYL